MRALALVLTVAACSYKPGAGPVEPEGDGPVTPEPDADPTDAPPDAFVGPPPTACVQSWLSGTPPTFTTPAFVDQTGAGSLNTQENERDPFVSSDQLIIYYARDVGGGDSDVLFASRATAADPFDAPFIKTTLSDDTAEDSKVAMTGDDLIAFIATQRAGGQGGADIWVTTRPTGGSTGFDAMSQEHLGSVNDAGNQLDPHVSPDGLRLYYANGSPQRIVVASRGSLTTDFGGPVAIPEITSTANDSDPTLSGDERVIIFSSTRPGGTGSGDLWYATRAERDQPFGEPQLLPFNSAQDDADAHLTADGCTVYFSSLRAAGNNDYDVFVTNLQ